MSNSASPAPSAAIALENSARAALSAPSALANLASAALKSIPPPKSISFAWCVRALFVERAGAREIWAI